MQLFALDLFAMKVSPIALLLALSSASGLAQPERGQRLDQVTSKGFLQQLIQDDVYFFIAPKVAESLLTRRVPTPGQCLPLSSQRWQYRVSF